MLRLGIDLGGSKIEIVALDHSGRELLRRREATPEHDYQATLDAIAKLVDGAERELGARGSVGIGTPGAATQHTLGDGLRRRRRRRPAYPVGATTDRGVTRVRGSMTERRPSATREE